MNSITKPGGFCPGFFACDGKPAIDLRTRRGIRWIDPESGKEGQHGEKK